MHDYLSGRKTCMNISVEEGSNLGDVVVDITEKYGIVKV